MMTSLGNGSVTMPADSSTQHPGLGVQGAALPPESAAQRRARKRKKLVQERRARKLKHSDAKKAKGDSRGHSRQRDDSASDCDSDLDLRKELKPIGLYVHHREEMLEHLFRSISTRKLRAMLPESCKVLSLDDLKSLCLEQLDAMSRKRILRILDGADPDTISSTDSEDDSSDLGPESEQEPRLEGEVADVRFAAAFEGASDESCQEDGSQSQYIDSTSLQEEHYSERSTSGPPTPQSFSDQDVAASSEEEEEQEQEEGQEGGDEQEDEHEQEEQEADDAVMEEAAIEEATGSMEEEAGREEEELEVEEEGEEKVENPDDVDEEMDSGAEEREEGEVREDGEEEQDQEETHEGSAQERAQEQAAYEQNTLKKEATMVVSGPVQEAPADEVDEQEDALLLEVSQTDIDGLCATAPTSPEEGEVIDDPPIKPRVPAVPSGRHHRHRSSRLEKVGPSRSSRHNEGRSTIDKTSSRQIKKLLDEAAKEVGWGGSSSVSLGGTSSRPVRKPRKDTGSPGGKDSPSGNAKTTTPTTDTMGVRGGGGPSAEQSMSPANSARKVTRMASSSSRSVGTGKVTGEATGNSKRSHPCKVENVSTSRPADPPSAPTSATSNTMAKTTATASPSVPAPSKASGKALAVKVRVKEPLKAPVPASAPAPAKASIKASTLVSASASTTAPASAPAPTPVLVKASVKKSIKVPSLLPTPASAEELMEAQVSAPSQGPANAPDKAAAPTKAPVRAAVPAKTTATALITTTAKAPAKTPIRTSVKAPIKSPSLVPAPLPGITPIKAPAKVCTMTDAPRMTLPQVVATTPTPTAVPGGRVVVAGNSLQSKQEAPQPSAPPPKKRLSLVRPPAALGVQQQSPRMVICEPHPPSQPNPTPPRKVQLKTPRGAEGTNAPTRTVIKKQPVQKAVIKRSLASEMPGSARTAGGSHRKVIKRAGSATGERQQQKESEETMLSENQMEILELEMRARAIKAMLKGASTKK